MQENTKLLTKAVKMSYNSSFSVPLPIWNHFSTTFNMATPSFQSPTPSIASIPDIPISVSCHLKCPICMDMLQSPVTTSCGHTFCKHCLERHLYLNDLSCPLCKQVIRKNPNPNVILKSILEEFDVAMRSNSKDSEDLAVAPDDVACDICPDNRSRKAVKSCLMCLLSFCPRHLKRHQKKLRLKGHKLVPATEELDQRACLTHGRPLELYWAREGKCICSICVEEGMEVISVEAERTRREMGLINTTKDLEQQIQLREEKVKEIEHSAAKCLAFMEQEKEEIKEAFDAVRKAVMKAEEEALGPLQNKKICVEREMKELKDELQREITTFQKTISDLEKIKNDEDHINFIQNCPSVPLSDTDKDWSGVAVDTDLTFGTMRNIQASLMADIETELEKLSRIEIDRIKKFEVDVTLDPDTAHAELLVSENGKEVMSSKQKRDVPDSPERFDPFGSILGRNKVTDGRAFWVVEVKGKQGWDIGVAREEAERKGKISLKPSQGYWSIVYYNGDQYAALEDPPTLLSLQDKPQKVGVFVDYQEGLVSFYDMEAKTHIYSFTDCVFREVVRPYFSPHLNYDEKNASPLVICPVSYNDEGVELEQ